MKHRYRRHRHKYKAPKPPARSFHYYYWLRKIFPKIWEIEKIKEEFYRIGDECVAFFEECHDDCATFFVKENSTMITGYHFQRKADGVHLDFILSPQRIEQVRVKFNEAEL